MPTTVLPLRTKCGEVYAWNCGNGEPYAVECHLCEERPFCTLTEYAEHMEVWHSSWHEDSAQRSDIDDLVQEVIDEIDAEHLDDDVAVMHDEKRFIMLKASNNNCIKLHNCANNECNAGTDTTQQHNSEVFQPFEQVLITNADDDLITTTTTTTTTTAAPAPPTPKTTTKKTKPITRATLNKATMTTRAKAAKLNNVGTPTTIQEKHSALETQTIATNSHADNARHSKDKETEHKRQQQSYIQDPMALNVKSQILFGLNEPITHNTRLSSAHVEHLIDLYRAHPRLWNQTHPEFSETHLVRQSWHDITNKWNQICHKQLTVADVRIRISTLCNRYIKERARLEHNGAIDECSKFIHFERLKFLDEQQTLQNRRKIFEQQNTKLIEFYKHYPQLWHFGYKSTTDNRKDQIAIESISTALKLCGIHLSPNVVMRRIKSLRKCYRVEKIRYLHSQVEQSKFEKQFIHFEQMKFLDKHINPFVCNDCGKIFEHLAHYREHVQKKNHGELPEMDEAMVSSCSNEFDTDNESQWEEEMMLLSASERASNENNSKTNSIHQLDYEEAKITRVKTLEDELVEEIIAEVEREMAENFNDNSDETIEMGRTDNKPVIAAADSATDSQFNTVTSEVCPTTPTDNPQRNELVVNVACGSYSYDLKLSQSTSTVSADTDDVSGSDDDKSMAGETFARLTLHQTHSLIRMYKRFPTLWDPNHLDYHSRIQRREAWLELTKNLNKTFNMRYSWKTLHRKLTDFVKYYRRERQRLETRNESGTKWCFYDDFAFLDDVVTVKDELHRTLQNKATILKIIKIYENHPQLWNTEHPEYSKRSHRQKYIESLNTELQEANIHLPADRLRNRLIEFRYNYRMMKEKRLKAEKRNETMEITYEFYEALRFLEPHVAPFQCVSCDMLFKVHSDYALHKRKAHDKDTHSGDCDSNFQQLGKGISTLDNICHICGLKFTLRSNLICHLRRHLNERQHACTMCPKKFFTKTSLKVHIRTHTKEQPYQCDKCGRSFVNTSKLNQHLKRHMNARNYPCKHCEKRFFTAFERDRHERVHLQIRDKICPICGKDFIKGSAYYTHMDLHRAEKRFKCDICHEKFAQHSGLYRHRKRHHQ